MATRSPNDQGMIVAMSKDFKKQITDQNTGLQKQLMDPNTNFHKQMMDQNMVITTLQKQQVNINSSLLNK